MLSNWSFLFDFKRLTTRRLKIVQKERIFFSDLNFSLMTCKTAEDITNYNLLFAKNVRIQGLHSLQHRKLSWGTIICFSLRWRWSARWWLNCWRWRWCSCTTFDYGTNPSSTTRVLEQISKSHLSTKIDWKFTRSHQNLKYISEFHKISRATLSWSINLPFLFSWWWNVA